MVSSEITQTFDGPIFHDGNEIEGCQRFEIPFHVGQENEGGILI